MERYYFIGIGGTAMASVAAALASAGALVEGSDAGVYPPMSDFLDGRGISYHHGFHQNHITAAVNAAHEAGDPDPIFVIGNAISRGNAEAEEVLDRSLPFTSLAALVGARLINGATSVVVSGTHGKTTTASLAAWVLEHAGRAPGFLIGGLPGNFGEGCRPANGRSISAGTRQFGGTSGNEGSGCDSAKAIFVSEGDEYDTAFFDKRSKFVHYRPDIAIINNIEFDHADIFGSIDDILRAFGQLVALVPRRGLLIVNGDDERARAAVESAHTPVEFFGAGADCTWALSSITISPSHTSFHVSHRADPAWTRGFTIPLSGAFNARNALGVIAACRRLALTPDEVQHGFDTFAGVRRRMDVIGDIAGITVVDDFAHHPTAIRETLAAAAARWPSRRIIALFEPRSNTTTRRIFQKELGEAFGGATRVVIGAVNRAERYAENERLSVDRLVADITAAGIPAQHIPDTEAMVRAVAADARSGDVIILLSNGAFGGAHARLLAALRER